MDGFPRGADAEVFPDRPGGDAPACGRTGPLFRGEKSCGLTRCSRSICMRNKRLRGPLWENARNGNAPLFRGNS